jgi:hypothetical protein
MIRLSIMLPVCLAIHLPVLLPIHLSILLSVSLAVLLPVLLPVCLAIGLPIRPAIFLADVSLREHHVGYDGWGCHGHDQAGNHSGFQETVLHNTSSLCARERVMSTHSGCSSWTVPIQLSHLVARSNQPVT